MKEIGVNEGIEGCLRRVIATHVYVFFDEGVTNKHDHCSVCDECWVKHIRDKLCLSSTRAMDTRTTGAC